MIRRADLAGIVLLLATATLLTACQGGGLRQGGGRGSATGSPGGVGGGNIKELVSIGAQDMKSVDAYFKAGAGGKNTRWILGDEVDVVASKEYFSQILTVNRGDLVARTDRTSGEATLITLTYMGNANQASAMTNPRIQFGTGLTVTAYKQIRLRMLPTTNSSLPIRLNVVAKGRASRGHKEEVLERGAIITTGGNMVQGAGRWVWVQTGSY